MSPLQLETVVDKKWLSFLWFFLLYLTFISVKEYSMANKKGVLKYLTVSFFHNVPLQICRNNVWNETNVNWIISASSSDCSDDREQFDEIVIYLMFDVWFSFSSSSIFVKNVNEYSFCFLI